MKKFLFIFLFLPLIAFSQERIPLIGNVFDGVTFFPITEANIYNFSSKKYSFTNKDGNFEILAKLGDTIVISKPIYKQALIEVTQEIIDKNFLDVALFYKVITLKEINVFALPGTYEAFKQDFVNVNFTNFNRSMGLSREEKAAYSTGSPNLLNLIPGEVGKAIVSPISYFYNKFSRKMRIERLYQELVDNQEEVDRLPLKYNRELVSSLTGLKGEELLTFMVFCRFSYYDLIRWSPEFIITQIQRKFDDFQYHKALQDN